MTKESDEIDMDCRARLVKGPVEAMAADDAEGMWCYCERGRENRQTAQGTEQRAQERIEWFGLPQDGIVTRKKFQGSNGSSHERWDSGLLICTSWFEFAPGLPSPVQVRRRYMTGRYSEA